MITVNKNLFPFLLQFELEKLQKFMDKGKMKFTVTELSEEMGMNHQTTVAITKALQENGLADSTTVIYHTCNSENPIKTAPTGENSFDIEPTCPHCQGKVEGMHDLDFEIVATMHDPAIIGRA